MDPSRKRSSAADLPLLVAKAKRKRPNDNQISSKARLFFTHLDDQLILIYTVLARVLLVLPSPPFYTHQPY
jgi:hypothetical protein